MDPSDVERMRLKKQQQNAQRNERETAEESTVEEAVNVSEELRRFRMLWPEVMKRTLTTFRARGLFRYYDLSNEEWEQLGRDIANCDKLEEVDLEDAVGGADVGDYKTSFLFRGWTKSSSIKDVDLGCNGFGLEGVQSIVPFLQKASSLKYLDVKGNNIQSEGFNAIFRALRDSPIERLNCAKCGIESIEINSDCIPRNLQQLWIDDNIINADGCREVAKLLQGGATLTHLSLSDNRIGDDGVEILASVLQNNTSLKYLDLDYNRLSIEGRVMILKLMNNISRIEATLQTNCTLHTIYVGVGEDTEEIQECIDYASRFTSNREKVINTQLHSMRRADLCRLQGIEERSDDAFYGDFDPLHLPEILALVGRTHGLSELLVALKSSMTMLFSTVDKVKCLEQELDYHQARVASLQAQIAAIKIAEGNVEEVENDPSNKRRRT